MKDNLVNKSGDLVKDIVNDTISRAAALNCVYGTSPNKIKGRIVELSSAQPDKWEDTVYRKAVEMLLAHFVPEERYAEAVDGLKRLPSAQSGWIPCTPESKPKRCAYYLVTDDGYTEEAYLDCDGVWFSLDGNKLKDVTAWMEKPEPYKGGQDG